MAPVRSLNRSLDQARRERLAHLLQRLVVQGERDATILQRHAVLATRMAVTAQAEAEASRGRDPDFSAQKPRSDRSGGASKKRDREV